MITQAMYPIFERINLDAILIADLELRDEEQNFAQRLAEKIPHVLSNVYPKDTSSDYSKLSQHYSFNLGNGVKAYVLNISAPENFTYAKSINNNYDIIEPELFLKQFIKQISDRDIVIARFHYNEALKLKQLIETPVASRIDLKILPRSITNQFMEGDELDLNKSSTGWTPAIIKTEENESSQNDADNSAIFSVSQREFMTITNEMNVIPEPRSAEYIREVHFRREADGSSSVRVSDILINKDFPPDEEIESVVESLDQIVKEQRQKQNLNAQIRNITRSLSGVGINPYIGSNSCKECHPSAYDVWENSRHAKALQTLVAAKEDKNDSCLQCHVTIWEKPEFIIHDWSFDKFSDELGCETCHGPGLPHTKLIELATAQTNYELWDYIESVQPQLLTRDLTIEARSLCAGCHDMANSPDFDFVKYWEQIEHSFSDYSILDIVDRKQQERAEEARSRIITHDHDAEDRTPRLVGPNT